MRPRVIKNELDYEEALACVAGLMDSTPAHQKKRSWSSSPCSSNGMDGSAILSIPKL